MRVFIPAGLAELNANSYGLRRARHTEGQPGYDSSRAPRPTLSRRWRAQGNLTVHVLVKEIPGRGRATGIKGLRTERTHPDEIAGLHLVPYVVQEIHALALEHVQAVLHDMGLDGRD